MFNKLKQAIEFAKERTARAYYALFYGWAAFAVIFAATEVGNDAEDVHTPYYFILYAGGLVLANAIASATYEVERREKAHELDLLEPGVEETYPKATRAIRAAKTVMDVSTESLELGVQTAMWMLALVNGNDEDKDPSNYFPILIPVMLINIANILLLYKYAHHRDQQPLALTLFNNVVMNSVEASVVLNSQGYNWFFNGPGDLDRSSIAWFSLGVGVSLNLINLLTEKLLLHFKKVSTETLDLYRIARLCLVEASLASTLITAAAMDTTCDILDCDDPQYQPTENAVFYSFFFIGLIILGGLRSLHLDECKPHRIPEKRVDEIQALLDREPEVEQPTVSINI